MGDPAGIGPEIIGRALDSPAVYDACRPLVIGDASVMEQALGFMSLSAEIHTVSDPAGAVYRHGTIDVLDLQKIRMNRLRIGEVQAMCGEAAYEYIVRAVELVQEGAAHAIATAPINKESLQAAQVPFIGHTEILGALTDSDDPLTLFEIEKMRIFFLTRHVSLRQAIEMVKKQRVLDYLRRCSTALQQLGLTNARAIAVAGLNPHCGEHGMFGDEETTEIEPAIEAARAEGHEVVGPIGADSVFHLALQGRFGAVLSLYHDQGHIAAKTYDFYRTVSVTLGMPLLRTSVDHGTAFDVAGSGKADAAGMRQAVLSAARYAPSFVART